MVTLATVEICLILFYFISRKFEFRFDFDLTLWSGRFSSYEARMILCNLVLHYSQIQKKNRKNFATLGPMHYCIVVLKDSYEVNMIFIKFRASYDCVSVCLL